APASSFPASARIIPESSYWKKRPMEVGKTSTGWPPCPNTSDSMSHPNSWLYCLLYSRFMCPRIVNELPGLRHLPGNEDRIPQRCHLEHALIVQLDVNKYDVGKTLDGLLLMLKKRRDYANHLPRAQRCHATAGRGLSSGGVSMSSNFCTRCRNTYAASKLSINSDRIMTNSANAATFRMGPVISRSS